MKIFLCITLAFFISTVQGFAQNKTIEDAGDVLLFAIPATALATTFVVDDTKGSWQFAKSFLLNQAVTYGLKIVLNKPRPKGNGDHAFPSGHTSTVFQSASFIHRRYGFTYSIPGYLLAGYTAFSRIDAQKHDGYDIAAGAIIGIGSTLLFTKPLVRKDIEIVFLSRNDTYILGLTYKF